MGVADVEANLSEEKLLQVDMTDGGKVKKDACGCGDASVSQSE